MTSIPTNRCTALVSVYHTARWWDAIMKIVVLSGFTSTVLAWWHRLQATGCVQIAATKKKWPTRAQWQHHRPKALKSKQMKRRSHLERMRRRARTEKMK